VAHSWPRAWRGAAWAWSPRSGWSRRRGHRRLTGGRDTKRFFQQGRVGCGGHARHDEMGDDSPYEADNVRWTKLGGATTFVISELHR
jgi:hypothetical protein